MECTRFIQKAICKNSPVACPTLEYAQALFSKPFLQLVYDAQSIHRENFPSGTMQISTLLSIKTGGCPENCAYCPQSARYKTGIKSSPLMALDEVVTAAKQAKASGATRFCMGAAWRGPKPQDLDKVCDMIRAVKGLGMETCVTLGLLQEHQAVQLKEAGLDFYNHNVDTSLEFYDKIITTRTFQNRLDTLEVVRNSGIKVCCGGILGMGETNEDRLRMLVLLANLDPPPESVPINRLIPIPGTPLAECQAVEGLDFVRIVAVARCLMPSSYIRLSAGREDMSDELQTLCFISGVNSIFYGETLLTASNAHPEKDLNLLRRLGISAESLSK
ncbi:biotin synthase BioB [Holospora curviuscula]|uniref:Biotin synthase n=1 Tax=Holospora curviuscula TaxID=1082868 RepID=A0A2S5R9D6_9PROT|nr:biotin synthase BioB [Holospora curviuscula]PPE03939.1 Biotin synthase [Holospora curviuscula]